MSTEKPPTATDATKLQPSSLWAVSTVTDADRCDQLLVLLVQNQLRLSDSLVSIAKATGNAPTVIKASMEMAKDSAALLNKLFPPKK